jgi:hypothetical protein
MEALPPVVTTHVEFLLGGRFFPDPYGWEVDTRDVDTLLSDPRMQEDQIANRAYAFTFFDSVTVTVEDVPGVTGPVITGGTRVNKSKLHYLSGRVMTKAEVQAEIPDSDILVSNMEGNGWPTVIKCRTGNMQPFDPAEHVLVAPGTPLSRKEELIQGS